MGSLKEILDSNNELLEGLKQADQEILYYKKVLDGALDACIKKNKEILNLKSNLEETDKKVFKLEQQIRTLNIHLEEEREINADLEIENIKLKKQISSLKKNLESVNNNCYDDLVPQDDSSVISDVDSTLEDDDNVTILGNEISNDLSGFPILSNSMMDDSRFNSTSMLLATPSIVICKSTAKKPSRPCHESAKSLKPIDSYSATITKTTKPIDSSTYTKSTKPMDSAKPTKFDTYTKKGRRRSKSVDFQLGERTVIEPQQCELCLSKSQMRGNNDSPTLPWCPHGAMTPSSASLLATPSRTLFKNPLNPAHLVTSTPAPRSILKGGRNSLLKQVTTRQ